MENIYLIDYLGMIFLRAGYFRSEEEAQEWIDKVDSKRRGYYTVVVIDRASPDGVFSTRTYPRYAVQR